MEILEVKEVCKMLKVSRPTLASLPIPTVRIGKRDKYRFSDVKEFVEKNIHSGDYKKIAAEEKLRKRIQMKNKIIQYQEELKKSKPKFG